MNSQSKEYHSEWMRKWRAKNPEASKLILRKYYHKDVEKSRRLARESRMRAKNNPERMERIREYARNKMRRLAKTDFNHLLRKRMRTRIVMALKRGATDKSLSTMLLIGCNVEELKRHLESMWLPGMSWDNYGKMGWHIDHIKPCSSFNLIDPQQQKECFHFSNLQPLWWKDNLSKGKTFRIKDSETMNHWAIFQKLR